MLTLANKKNVLSAEIGRDVLCRVSTHEEVLKYIGRFIQFYRENGTHSEQTDDFVTRIGIEKLRQVLVADSNGICARLDAQAEAAANWDELLRLDATTM